MSPWGAAFAPFSNALGQSFLGKALLRSLGISTERELPSFSSKRFSKQLGTPKSEGFRGKVALFNDTYTEFYCPQLGLSAHALLEALGYQVEVLPWVCCGRPMISKGFLPQAREQSKRVVEALLPYAQAGLPILGLEPSCLWAIKDDYPSLLPSENTNSVAKACTSIDEFLAQSSEQLSFPSLLSEVPAQKVALHGHCHQKALVGNAPTLHVLRQFPQLQVSAIPSGCCGLAGSFGYEQEHYAFSMQVGEDRLFPYVRSFPEKDAIIANGFSCRSQILHGTHRPSLHLVEFLARGIP